MEQIMTFPLDPMPAIRMTTGQVKLMRIPRERLMPKQRKVRDRIEAYQKYKLNLQLIAASKKFQLPESQFWVRFYIETNKIERWGKAHRQKPDWDNLAKAMQDALCKSDSHIWDCRITKYWCKPGTGRIEVWA